MYTLEELQQLKRGKLQKLCKKNKLKAVGRNPQMVKRLDKYYTSLLQQPATESESINDENSSNNCERTSAQTRKENVNKNQTSNDETPRRAGFELSEYNESPGFISCDSSFSEIEIQKSNQKKKSIRKISLVAEEDSSENLLDEMEIDSSLKEKSLEENVKKTDFGSGKDETPIKLIEVYGNSEFESPFDMPITQTPHKGRLNRPVITRRKSVFDYSESSDEQLSDSEIKLDICHSDIPTNSQQDSETSKFSSNDSSSSDSQFFNNSKNNQYQIENSSESELEVEIIENKTISSNKNQEDSFCLEEDSMEPLINSFTYIEINKQEKSEANESELSLSESLLSEKEEKKEKEESSENFLENPFSFQNQSDNQLSIKTTEYSEENESSNDSSDFNNENQQATEENPEIVEENENSSEISGELSLPEIHVNQQIVDSENDFSEIQENDEKKEESSEEIEEINRTEEIQENDKIKESSSEVEEIQEIAEVNIEEMEEIHMNQHPVDRENEFSEVQENDQKIEKSSEEIHATQEIEELQEENEESSEEIEKDSLIENQEKIEENEKEFHDCPEMDVVVNEETKKDTFEPSVEAEKDEIFEMIEEISIETGNNNSFAQKAFNDSNLDSASSMEQEDEAEDSNNFSLEEMKDILIEMATENEPENAIELEMATENEPEIATENAIEPENVELDNYLKNASEDEPESTEIPKTEIQESLIVANSAENGENFESGDEESSKTQEYPEESESENQETLESWNENHESLEIEEIPENNDKEQEKEESEIEFKEPSEFFSSNLETEEEQIISVSPATNKSKISTIRTRNEQIKNQSGTITQGMMGDVLALLSTSQSSNQQKEAPVKTKMNAAKPIKSENKKTLPLPRSKPTQTTVIQEKRKIPSSTVAVKPTSRPKTTQANASGATSRIAAPKPTTKAIAKPATTATKPTVAKTSTTRIVKPESKPTSTINSRIAVSREKVPAVVPLASKTTVPRVAAAIKPVTSKTIVKEVLPKKVTKTTVVPKAKVVEPTAMAPKTKVAAAITNENKPNMRVPSKIAPARVISKPAPAATTRTVSNRVPPTAEKVVKIQKLPKVAVSGTRSASKALIK